MNHLKKIFFFLFLFASCFCLCFSTQVSAQQTHFSVSNETSVDWDHKQFNFKDNNEKLKFVYADKAILKLMSRNNKQDYLSFLNYETGKGSSDYVIRTIKTDNPSMTFYEIRAYAGAHGRSSGYWLIGRRNGAWVTFVTIDNLRTMGYNLNQENHISSKITDDGRFILTNKHSYMPPGAHYGYQKRMATDLQLELFWDQNAQWFGMRSL